MEKAILKTLIYADIFDYPLKINEIHKWLIGRKATLRQVALVLYRLNQPRLNRGQKSNIKYKKDYYFLPRKNGLVGKRLRRQKQSRSYFRKAKILSQVLKIIPWVKLVGISGGLAMGNAGKSDDIDIVVIASKNRLWICRLLILGLLSLVGQRRKRQEGGRKIAGKMCINILLEEDKLEQTNKDIFVAHEVLQMRVLWQRDGIYSKYLADNNWAFKFLPNWINGGRLMIKDLRFKNIHKSSIPIKSGSILSHKSLVDHLENLAKKFQLKIMQQPKGMERIEDGALYFHPQDCRQRILSEYRQRLKLAPLDK